MAVNIRAQIDALYAILDLLDGSGKPLASIYDWPNPMPESYPCSYPIWIENGEDVMDTKDNESATQFVIRTMIPDRNDETTYDTMIAVADALLAEFRKDDHYTLGGACHRLHVSPTMKPLRTGEGEEPMIVLDMNVTAYALQDTTT